ncbi:MAG: NAD-dependent epimerase/dehydratase family protein [Oligoflexia bacterium]|nr:NAD-dependent epimerase/dehydratase family protein [Oligoflexia bacterium]
MHCLVTGGAGFIGSNLVDRLLEMGHKVSVIDDFSTGLMDFLKSTLENADYKSRFKLYRGDLLTEQDTTLQRVFDESKNGIDFVFHLAANADVRFGLDHPKKDLEQNTIVTFNVLEAMRRNGCRRIAFSSTGSVYGEAKVIPTPEDAHFPIQTSLYGTSKLAAEGLIMAYSEGYNFQSYIFRFVSILGERYTHGHIFDFYKKLLVDPYHLEILGDGKQKKSYLYIGDCIDAILMAIEKATDDKVNVFNLGTDEYCQVNDSVGWICEHLGLKPKLTYTGGERGWIGDNPFIFLDCSKIRKIGHQPKYSIKDAVIKTLEYLKNNKGILNAR